MQARKRLAVIKSPMNLTDLLIVQKAVLPNGQVLLLKLPFLSRRENWHTTPADSRSREGWRIIITIYIHRSYHYPLYVTTSTTEAELRAATEAAKRLYIWKRVFEAIGFKPEHELSIQCDNTQTIRLLTSPEPNFHTSLRHIDIYHHWLRQEIQSKRLHIQWVDTKRMVADGLTKLLKGQIFVNWRKHQGLVDIAHLLQE
ncbi:hypothetical protein TSTA_082830 [Talaromyces stipitatus ATCC 10500]|uniref:Reverse transcriptase Ty1/copia-type domain-containing protein n=1 Tax=Talaromyces stipitatus (strain ATCC 10500 / CBS 375.48 / QM 6759 / NRRL 1006) TaxID=441959 RepID=B8M1A8_TALSN|nr:uncharacterized protein TSTA_082830 [Talaromyces stipitatus ATCC 10500]EED21050.1 hypothetical protein TSTA_082830 [Talaromyces stipitatus ATCC 10500]